MRGGSIAGGSVIVGVVLLLAASLGVYAMDARSVVSDTITPASSPTTDVPSPTLTGTAGVVILTNPGEFEALQLGENFTVSGTVPPTARLPDYVLIQVNQQGSVMVLDSGYVSVQPGGSFWYSAVVGMTWPSGTYVITATDSYGAVGDLSVTVTYGDVWCC